MDLQGTAQNSITQFVEFNSLVSPSAQQSNLPALRDLRVLRGSSDSCLGDYLPSLIKLRVLRASVVPYPFLFTGMDLNSLVRLVRDSSTAMRSRLEAPTKPTASVCWLM